MFKIYDGRPEFWQWDLNQKIIVKEACQVHFCNGGDCALVVDTYEQDGLILADVPNILLQEAKNITAFAYVCADASYTKVSVVFGVRARTKPDTYAYTETEVKTWESLAGAIPGIVEDALEKAKESGEFDGKDGKDGDENVFIATYGVTTTEEMEAAYNAGKVLFCKDGGNVSPLFGRTDVGSFVFYNNNQETLTKRSCTAKFGWNKTTHTLCGEKFEALDDALGDIDTALDGIIAIQNTLIGGSAE